MPPALGADEAWAAAGVPLVAAARAGLPAQFSAKAVTTPMAAATASFKQRILLPPSQTATTRPRSAAGWPQMVMPVRHGGILPTRRQGPPRFPLAPLFPSLSRPTRRCNEKLKPLRARQAEGWMDKKAR
jgi:hypothetical protein